MTVVDTSSLIADETQTAIALEKRHAARNYAPLPVVAASAEGAWIVDVDGRRYLDCLAGYSAVNFGHRHPAIISTAHAQLDNVTLVSRAFHSDRLGPFCKALAGLCGKDMVLPMNSGAEAVESGIKVARKWGADVKKVSSKRANIIVADNNFHGRTITIVSFSSDPSARDGFGPFTPGFRSVPFGDTAAVARAIDKNTVAVLLEPIQGEAGIVVPPDDYLPASAGAVHGAQRPDDRGRNPVRARADRSHLRVRPLGRGARHVSARQGPRRRGGAALGGSRRSGRTRRAASRASTVRRSAATRWPWPSDRPWSRC